MAATLIAVLLGLHIGNSGKEFGLVLTVAVCCMGAAAALTFLEPVLDFLRELEAVVQVDNGVLGTLMKCTGMALVSELAGLICQDSGNGSLGKMVQMLGSAVILFLSLPMIQSFLELLQGLLGEL